METCDMKQICISCVIDLPNDLFDAAQHTVKFQPLWAALLKGLDAAGIKYTVQVDVGETRKAPARRGRKPRERLPTLDEVRGILAPEAAE